MEVTKNEHVICVFRRGVIRTLSETTESTTVDKNEEPPAKRVKTETEAEANVPIKTTSETTVEVKAVTTEKKTDEQKTPAITVPAEDKQVTDENAFEMQEIEEDLFGCGAECSLAHCVSRDLAMGKGIAKTFKSLFGGVDELRAQQKRIGECAYLSVGKRFVYYLVTKERYFHKPTQASLRACLLNLLELCQKHGVRQLAVPRLGCGLDGMQWRNVKPMIADVFANSGVQISVYYVNV